MKKRGEITTFTSRYEGNYMQQRFVPNVAVDMSWFSSDEKSMIDRVISKYSDYSAIEISNLSHEDKPWQIAHSMDVIDYSLVKVREYPFSPLKTEKQKKETQHFARMT